MFIKILEVIKRPLTQLVVFVFLLLCLPYLAPFMQGGSSEFHSLSIIGAILCMFFIDNKLLGKLFSFVFPLDKLDYGWYVTCG